MSAARRGKAPPPRPPSREATASLRASILRWYRTHRRDLPWRRTRDPYAIWVSEIMLQQTRVETVIPFFERFLDRFPTIEALAKSREADVLASWSGLGYYRRARNLRAAAGSVVREHGGRLPDRPEMLRRLPGIGPYTAGAIASVAFDRPHAAVDGNVIRVLGRIGGLKGRRDDPGLKREVAGIAESLAPGPSPAEWTQALMELGALVCLPGEPACAVCPARSRCLAHRSGSPARYPEPARTPSVPSERRVMLLARREGRLLLVREGPCGEGGWWSLPQIAGRSDPGRAARSLARSLGVEGSPRGPVGRFQHQTFAHRLHVEIWSVDTRAERTRDGRWVDPRAISKLPIQSPTLKALRALTGHEGIPKRSRS